MTGYNKNGRKADGVIMLSICMESLVQGKILIQEALMEIFALGPPLNETCVSFEWIPYVLIKLFFL